ncbi:hypothetical protein [Haloarcula onubensis]|uniref:DUF4239 domain-containing protein n=1 Tax=Haloarcula onubensis TaxID=2950539 RepID=A0ABU2FNE2_9EURY|nr:hypothetical protein [Halomicroarcula sp. S3CR25-11]MDS0282284.1 hypothetical protein [Halomicroarcula sp. S3CR25-11]
MSHSDHDVDVSTTGPTPSGVVQSSVTRWVLTEGNRWLVAVLFSALAAAVVGVLGWLGVVGVDREGPVTLLLSVFIGGNLTLVPVTITINQLVLSREFGKPHDLRERDEGVIALRDELRALAGVPLIAPAPTAFLRELTATLDDSATDVYDEAAATGSEDLARRAEAFRAEVTAGTDGVERALSRADFGSYESLSAMLDLNSAWLVAAARHLHHDHDEAVAADPFERMEATLRLFNVTRQYVKTLYAQKEIATLSRLLLYTGFLAVLVAAVWMLSFAAPGRPPAVVTSIAGFSLLSAVVFAPLAFLLSYTLRLSTLMSYPPLRNSFITDG